jgi:hypothetical protein
MENKQDKKIDILLSALQERYNAQHIIRSRVQNTGVWVVGILGAIGGWILKERPCFTLTEVILIIGFFSIALYIIRCVYLEDLNKGFKGQQRSASRVEKALGFYKKDEFIKDDTLYPESWEKAGTEDGEGRFFKTTFYLIYLGFAFVILALVLV